MTAADIDPKTSFGIVGYSATDYAKYLLLVDRVTRQLIE